MMNQSPTTKSSSWSAATAPTAKHQPHSHRQGGEPPSPVDAWIIPVPIAILTGSYNPNSAKPGFFQPSNTEASPMGLAFTSHPIREGAEVPTEFHSRGSVRLTHPPDAPFTATGQRERGPAQDFPQVRNASLSAIAGPDSWPRGPSARGERRSKRRAPVPWCFQSVRSRCCSGQNRPIRGQCDNSIRHGTAP